MNSRSRTFQRITARLAPFACLPLALIHTSCSRNPSPSQAQARAGGAVPVLVATVQPRDIPVDIRAIGNVQAYSAVSIRSQITAPITQVHFQEGQEVHTGDLLFSLDPRPYEAALAAAKASLIRDQAQWVSARLEFERTSNLFAGKISSQQDYDTAQAAYQMWQGTVMADNAAISNSEVNLSYTSIRAPIDGRTGNLTVKTGNVVKAPDDILLSLTQVYPIYVAFAVPEQNLPAIRRESQQKHLPVTAVSPGDLSRPASGELTFINNMVDTNTGTILLKATFANPDEVLWPGQFVQVSMTLSNLTQAIVVPSQAIQTGQNGEFVFVVKPDLTVETRPVTTGVVYQGLTVVNNGLHPQETVVTDGQLRLTPGAKVDIKPPEAAGEDTNSLANSESK